MHGKQQLGRRLHAAPLPLPSYLAPPPCPPPLLPPCSLLGLEQEVKELIAGGKGAYRRYAESGAVLVDRSRHLDMLEWAWWLNAMGDGLTYKYMYGDKDAFGVAFALAGKPKSYYQVCVCVGGGRYGIPVCDLPAAHIWAPCACGQRRQIRRCRGVQ